MDRRELIKYVATLMGGALSAPAILGVLNGCAASSSARSKPAFLTKAQREVVAEIVEIMIPRTDTPGAQDIGVPAFIDTMLEDAYAPADQARYVSGLAEFEALAQSAHGRKFLDLNAEERRTLVQRVHDEASAAELAAAGALLKPRRPFVLMTKELALLGFFCSQVGATQVLQYDPVPGAYHGCIPLEEAGNGKTWAKETSGRF